jgi:hypothetical protein
VSPPGPPFPLLLSIRFESYQAVSTKGIRVLFHSHQSIFSVPGTAPLEAAVLAYPWHSDASCQSQSITSVGLALLAAVLDTAIDLATVAHGARCLRPGIPGSGYWLLWRLCSHIADPPRLPVTNPTICPPTQVMTSFNQLRNRCNGGVVHDCMKKDG